VLRTTKFTAETKQLISFRYVI